MAGEPDWHPMKSELDEIKAATDTVKVSTDAVKAACDSIKLLTTTTSYEEGTDAAISNLVGVLPAGTTRTNVNITGKGRLEQYEIGTTGEWVAIMVQIDGLLIFTPVGGDQGSMSPTVNLLHTRSNDESYFFKVGIYDTINNYYSLRIRRPLYFNTSLLLQVQNTDAVNDYYASSGWFYRVRP